MKKTFTLAALAALTLTCGLAFAEDGVVTQSRDYKLPKCPKPLGTLVVGKIECKTSACQAGAAAAGGVNPVLQLMQMAQMAQSGGSGGLQNIGSGLGDMLTTALKETGCFQIQERQALDDINKELALVGKKVDAKQADFLVTGSVTSVELSTDSKSIGWGMIPIIGSVGSTTQKAAVSIDIRVIDVNKAEVLDSKTIVANSENSSFAVGAGGYGGIGGFGGAMSNMKGTSLEAVSREAIASSTIFVANTLFKAKGVVPAAQ